MAKPLESPPILPPATKKSAALDVLLEANVSNAYLDMGTEVLNGTKSPQEAMDFIRKVALEAKAAM